jgi:uncharacterized damage-inducible protein DinB
MSDETIRPAYVSWPTYNRRVRDVVAALTDEQLALRPSPERWPIWATIGHIACQRISWLCGFAGEPGAEASPFPDALHRCPGDEYLEPAMGAGELAEALDSTFRVVEACLDRWTFDVLGEEIRRTFGDETWAHTRGWVIGRVFAHDVYHVAEMNEVLGAAGLLQVDLWD